MTTTWTNWSGSVVCQPRQMATPASEHELQALIAQCAERKQRVRVVGSGHSFTPICATNETLISLDHLSGVESIDPSQGVATIRGGTKIHDLGEPLWNAGWALANQGDVDVQSLAGAVSTGTHGTGATLGNLSAQVVGLRLVTAAGELLAIEEDRDPQLLAAARVSLGMLGVISAIRMKLVPAYNLHERLWRGPIDDCLAQLDELIATNRHFEFFWYSATDLAHMKALHPAAGPTAEPLPEGERIDRSCRIFPTVRSNRFNEMEYAVPAEAGPDCFRALRELMRTRHPDVAWPVEYRTLAADDSLLSAAQGRPTVTLSIHQGADLPYQQFFADAEAIFRDHHGRPHWGKIHSLAAGQLQTLWPGWEPFQQTRRRLDPTELFLNDYLRSLCESDSN